VVDKVDQNVVSWSQGGHKLELWVSNVDPIVTSWCQKEQIKTVVDEVDSGTDLNFLDHDIQSIPVRPTTMSLIK
jgi:hypothetical protein